MSILGLHCGRRMGNSEILLKESLMGAEERSGVQAEIIRLMDLTIEPCTGCEACARKRSRGEDMECVHKDDHASFLLQKVLECDALIVSTPVYTLTPPGFLKTITERVFRHAEAPLKPKVGALICVGGTDWVSLALPLANLCLPHKIKLVDQQLVTYTAGSGQVLMNDRAIADARRLGRRVGEAMGVPIEEVKYLGEEQEACPLCHSNLLSLRGKFVECLLCGIKGTIEIKEDRISVIYTEEELARSRWGGLGSKKHVQEILETHQAYDENLPEIRKRIEKYRAYKFCLVPPPLKEKRSSQ
jgi:multimeric flavodoxin WrbA